MKTIPRPARTALIPALAIATLGLLASGAIAQTPQFYRAGDLEIHQPWTRATPKGAPVAGGYVKITNTGKSADRLTGATFATAAMVQIHSMTVTGGVMKMQHIDGGLEIKPGKTVTLKPGGLHLMFMRLRSGVSMGKPVKGSLVFEKAGIVNITFQVMPIGATKPAPASK